MYQLNATIKIIGVNPYVSIPNEILEKLFEDAGKKKGPIPISGQIEGKAYTQTLVKYAGEWRLYINTTMVKNSPQLVGKNISITVAYDAIPRIIPMHPLFESALNKNPEANKVFSQLIPSRQKEIVRYIAHLKSDESITKNVDRAIQFLLGKTSFVGRKKP